MVKWISGESICPSGILFNDNLHKGIMYWTEIDKKIKPLSIPKKRTFSHDQKRNENIH